MMTMMMIECSVIIPILPTVKEKMMNDSSTGIKYYLLPYSIHLGFMSSSKLPGLPSSSSSPMLALMYTSFSVISMPSALRAPV